MARLYRFVKLNDRADTHVFTFLLPKSIIHDNSRDIVTKDFVYGQQKWALSLTKSDKQLGVSLTLRQVTEGMCCTLDFGVTLVNKDHFTKNDSFLERNCVFTFKQPTYGRTNFIGVSELTSRGFPQDTEEFMIDVELRNIRSYFDTIVQLPSEHSKSSQYGGSHRYHKYETNYFAFGNFEWNLAVYPFGDRPDADGQPMVYLVRQTNFDHLCKVQYRLTLGSGDRRSDSDVIYQTFNTSGHGQPYRLSCSIYNMADNKSKLPIRIDFISAVALSQVQLTPLNRHKNKTHLYDRDKQAWMIESDASLDYLKFRIYFTDTRNVPRNHMRYNWWAASVLPARGHYKPMPCIDVPFAQYYFQMDVDAEGYDMHTDISVKEISNPASAILDKEGRLTVQIEWLDAHLLYNERFNRLDEVNGRHKIQMSREIMALQAENLSLEKQIYSYQVSISRTNSKNGKDDPLSGYSSPVVPPPVIISEDTLSGGPTSISHKSKDKPERKSSERRRSRSRDRRKSKEQVSADPYYDSNVDKYSESQYLSADPYASEFVSSSERHVDGADASTLMGAEKCGSDYVPSAGYQDKVPHSPKDKYASDPYGYQDSYSKQGYAATTDDYNYQPDRYDKRYAGHNDSQYYSNGKYPSKYPEESTKPRRDKHHDVTYKDDKYIDNQHDTYSHGDRYDKFKDDTYDKYPSDPALHSSSYSDSYQYPKKKKVPTATLR